MTKQRIFFSDPRPTPCPLDCDFAIPPLRFMIRVFHTGGNDGSPPPHPPPPLMSTSRGARWGAYKILIREALIIVSYKKTLSWISFDVHHSNILLLLFLERSAKIWHFRHEKWQKMAKFESQVLEQISLNLYVLWLITRTTYFLPNECWSPLIIFSPSY